MSTKHTMGEEWKDAEREAFENWFGNARSDVLPNQGFPPTSKQMADYWFSRLSYQREQVLDEAIELLNIIEEANGCHYCSKVYTALGDVEKRLQALKNKDNE